ncbi:MAG: DUF4270 family protein [Ginsengibacter sp.]
MSKSQYKTAVAGVLISFLFATSCTKIDTTKLGADLLPAVDNIHTFDTTVNVIANNFDNLPSCDTLNRTDLNALGIISDDPYFGKTKADIYVEFKPSFFPVKVPEHDAGGLFIDSAVIVMSYLYSYGDTNAIQKAIVYPLQDRFKPDSLYTSCDAFQYQNTVLGEKNYVPARFKDSIVVGKGKTANELRIPINKSLAEQWFANATTVLASDSAFKINNKGFAIISDAVTGGNAINYFDLSNPNTRLAIYFRTTKGEIKDTAVFNFPMTNTSGEANYIQRTRGTSEITNHLTKPVAGDEVIYIQTSPGNHAELKIPALTNLSNRVIHRAELVMEQVYSTTTMDQLYTPPHMLYLEIKDVAAGTFIPIPCDFSQEAIQSRFAILGGQAKKVVNLNGNTVSRYTFNITRYVQNIVTNKESNSVIRLSAPYYIHNNKMYTDRCIQMIAPFHYGMNNLGDGRVKLHGTDGSTSRMKMRIVYSKL